MHIGDTFPNLQGATQDVDSFDLYQHIGDHWAVVFSHPGDFTPVCTTELASAAELQLEFKNRNVKLIGFSCNDQRSHRRWMSDIEYVSGFRVEFPLFCDPSRENAIKLGILDPRHQGMDGLPLTVRGTFILKPDKTIALMMVYPHAVGRNLEELLRSLDSLLLTEKTPEVVTPSNWNQGDDVLVAYPVNDEEAKLQFGGDGFRVVNVPSEQGKAGLKKHYLRYTKPPIMTRPSSRKKNTSDAGCWIS